MATRAVWRWWQTRHIRAENNARFLEDGEARELLSRSHKGLLLDGVDGRLTPDSSFRNLALIDDGCGQDFVVYFAEFTDARSLFDRGDRSVGYLVRADVR